MSYKMEELSDDDRIITGKITLDSEQSAVGTPADDLWKLLHDPIKAFKATVDKDGKPTKGLSSERPTLIFRYPKTVQGAFVADKNTRIVQAFQNTSIVTISSPVLSSPLPLPPVPAPNKTQRLLDYYKLLLNNADSPIWNDLISQQFGLREKSKEIKPDVFDKNGSSASDIDDFVGREDLKEEVEKTLKAILADPQRTIYIKEIEGQAYGHLHFGKDPNLLQQCFYHTAHDPAFFERVLNIPFKHVKNGVEDKDSKTKFQLVRDGSLQVIHQPTYTLDATCQLSCGKIVGHYEGNVFIIDSIALFNWCEPPVAGN
jgi:hypothetical protein